MNQQPNNFDFDESNNGFKLPQSTIRSNENDENIPLENIRARKKQLGKLLLILMGIGLSLGLLLSAGLIILLNKLGLNKKPFQLEQKKQQQIEQIQQRTK